MLIALVVGGYGFELVGLSSELGALLLGALLAKHRRSGELSKSLWSIKEFFLVGFFLQIGIGGLPDQQAWVFALVMTALLPLALTAALSFLVSAPLNRLAHPLYERLASRLLPFERNSRHPDEQPVSLGDAQVLIMGLGRTGTAAYEHLKDKCRVIALDSDPARVEMHEQMGHNVFFADAEDQVFWQSLDLGNVSAVILTINDMEAKIIAARKLRLSGFKGQIVSHSMHSDEAEKIIAAGADQTYLTMSEAGVGLAEHVYQSALAPVPQ